MSHQHPAAGHDAVSSGVVPGTRGRRQGNVEHHIEEEESEMYKQARHVLERQELEDLGARMAERKATTQQELGIPVAR